MISTAIAAGALAAGAGFVGLALAFGRLAAGIAAAMSAHRTWVLSTLVLTAVLVVVTTVTGAVTEHRARARERRLRELARLDRVDTMTGPQFEDLVADLLRRDGYLDVTVVGRSGDQGADVTARTPGGRRLAVQCKRQSRAVSADRVRNLVGAVHCAYAGHQGVLVTSGYFTRPAAEEGRDRIIMIDRDRLGTWMAGDRLDL